MVMHACYPKTEIWKIMVPGQARQKSSHNLMSTEKSGHSDTCLSFYQMQEDHEQAGLGKKARPTQKLPE
jgi:hypothetical protein